MGKVSESGCRTSRYGSEGHTSMKKDVSGWTSCLHLQILCSELCSSFLRSIILEGWESLLATILTWCGIRGFFLWERQLWELTRGGEVGGQALVGMWSCPAVKELQQWSARESQRVAAGSGDSGRTFLTRRMCGCLQGGNCVLLP